MKHFFSVKALILLSFFIFTVMCSGGCGGSSSVAGSSESVPEAMRVFSIGDIREVDNRESVMFALMAVIHELLGTSDDISTITSRDALMVFSFGESDHEDIINSLKKDAAIIVLCPTTQIIQKLVNAVGLSDYKVPDISKGEIFAIKKRDAEASVFYIPSMADMLPDSSEPLVTSDTASRDVVFTEDTREAVDPDPSSDDEFHKMRFDDFMSWLGTSNDMTVSAADFASSRPLLKGTAEYDFSYTASPDQYGTPRHVWKSYYTAYAVHSFSDGCDYYIVELRSKNNPKGQFSHKPMTLKKKPKNDTVEIDCTVDVATGYTRALSFRHYIASDDDGDIDTVVAAPSAQSGTNSLAWDFGGLSAYSWVRGDQLLKYLEVERSLRYNNNLTIDRTSSVVIQREESNWNLFFTRPIDGDDHIVPPGYDEATDYTKTYKGINVFDASSKVRTDYFAWVWRVPRDYWEKKGSPKFFKTEVSAIHGRTEGYSFYSPLEKVYRVPRVDLNWYTSGKTVNVPLPKPPHIATTADMYFTSRGAGTGSFSFASEEDWTATIDNDWITLSDTSGTATGAMPIIVSFHYDANNTGADRTGTVTFKCNNSGETAKVIVTQRY